MLTTVLLICILALLLFRKRSSTNSERKPQMITLIFLFLVMVGLIVFLTIFDAITSIFNPKVLTGGVLGFFLVKWLNKREDNK